MTAARRSFARRIDALAEIVAFTAAFCERAGADAAARTRLDLGIEELFTNIVKYGGGGAPVVIELAHEGEGMVATLIDDGGAPFDATRAPAPDLTLPLERRPVGGLGLHLVRGLVDAIEYRYDAARRQGRVTIRIGLAPAAAATKTGD